MRTDWSDDDEIYTEACRLYFKRFGIEADQPNKGLSEVINRFDVPSRIILRNVNGVLAVYKIVCGNGMALRYYADGKYEEGQIA